MDFRKIFLAATCIFSIAISGGASYAADGNAVGGSAYADTSGGGPLGDVQVTVAQDSSIRDQTRSEDGVFTLKVRSTLKQFDLIYQKAGYLDTHDFDIQNDKEQQKRAVARMTPTSRIGTLPGDKLSSLVDASIAALRRGKKLSVSALQESGKRNLETLQENIKPATPALVELKAKIRQSLLE